MAKQNPFFPHLLKPDLPQSSSPCLSLQCHVNSRKPCFPLVSSFFLKVFLILVFYEYIIDERCQVRSDEQAGQFSSKTKTSFSISRWLSKMMAWIYPSYLTLFHINPFILTVPSEDMPWKGSDNFVTAVCSPQVTTLLHASQKWSMLQGGWGCIDW